MPIFLSLKVLTKTLCSWQNNRWKGITIKMYVSQCGWTSVILTFPKQFPIFVRGWSWVTLGSSRLFQTLLGGCSQHNLGNHGDGDESKASLRWNKLNLYYACYSFCFIFVCLWWTANLYFSPVGLCYKNCLYIMETGAIIWIANIVLSHLIVIVYFPLH